MSGRFVRTGGIRNREIPEKFEEMIFLRLHKIDITGHFYEPGLLALLRSGGHDPHFALRRRERFGTDQIGDEKIMAFYRYRS